MKVVIMSGISGSGKDTYIKNNYVGVGDFQFGSICSADDFFMQNTWDDQKYIFDHSKLNEAHGACLRKFIRRCQATVVPTTIVVNNTNTTAIEIAPYFAIASAYKAEIELVTLLVDPKVAAARNVHGVPLESCIAMDKRLRSRSLPKFWNYKNTVVNQ